MESTGYDVRDWADDLDEAPVESMDSAAIIGRMDWLARKVAENSGRVMQEGARVVEQFSRNALDPSLYVVDLLRARVREAAREAPRVPGRSSTWDLPGGLRLEVRAGREKLEVADEDAAIDFLLATAPEAVAREFVFLEKVAADKFAAALELIEPKLTSEDVRKKKVYKDSVREFLKQRYGALYEDRDGLIELPGIRSAWPEASTRMSVTDAAGGMVADAFGATRRASRAEVAARKEVEGCVGTRVSDWCDARAGMPLAYLGQVARKLCPILVARAGQWLADGTSPAEEGERIALDFLARLADLEVRIAAWLATRAVQTPEYRDAVLQRAVEAALAALAETMDVEDASRAAQGELDMADRMDKAVAARIEGWLAAHWPAATEASLPAFQRLWMYAEILAEAEADAAEREAELADLKETFVDQPKVRAGSLRREIDLLARAFFEREGAGSILELPCGLQVKLAAPKDRDIEILDEAVAFDYLRSEGVSEGVFEELRVRTADAVRHVAANKDLAAMAGKEERSLVADAVKRIVGQGTEVPGVAVVRGAESVSVARRSAPAPQTRTRALVDDGVADKIRARAQVALVRAGVAAPQL
jgi:hypothetical protein